MHLAEGPGGHVARMALSRPPLNVLDTPMLLEMAAAVHSVTRAPIATRPRVLLLTSDIPGQFSLGVDPNAVLSTDIAGRAAIFMALADLVEALWFGGIPVVADISGPAIAGGAVLAAVADFAVIDGQVGKISFSETKVGLPLPGFIQQLIRSKIAPPSWNEVMLLGKNIDASEAQRIGFANATYKTPTEREEVLGSLVGRIARLAPAVLAQTLTEGRAAGRHAIAEFRANIGPFSAFLGDDYLGKGMQALAKGESPRF